jgi:hypothetical protein
MHEAYGQGSLGIPPFSPRPGVDNVRRGQPRRLLDVNRPDISIKLLRL